MSLIRTHTLKVFLLLPFLLRMFPWSSISTLTPTPTPDPDAIVRAVLFYSPSCGHCYYVITEVFPPLFDKYGDHLQIVGIDVTGGGHNLYLAALNYFGSGSNGVPFLVVGDTYLIGSIDIPEKFPELIEQYLAQGGVDWPKIPGLLDALSASQSIETPTRNPNETILTPTFEASRTDFLPTDTQSTLTSTQVFVPESEIAHRSRSKFTQDLHGNSLAVVVLIGMVTSLVGSLLFIKRFSVNHIANMQQSYRWGWLFPVLCIIGLGIASYLSYVETTQVQAVCGPVGDCNTVQQSPYARLFGLIPIGILGVFGFLLLLLAWLVIKMIGNRRLQAYTSLVIFILTLFGVLFSIYLTFLEPFVIGATCAWCLASAISMTALFWLSLQPALNALHFLKKERLSKNFD